VDVWLARRGRLIDQPGAGRGATDSVLLMEFQVGEFEDQFLQRLGVGLSDRGNIRGESLPRGNQDRIHRRLDSARVAAHGDVDRFLAEEFFQHAELRAVQRERNDWELVLAALVPQR
jgi:hypothetical protein